MAFLLALPVGIAVFFAARAGLPAAAAALAGWRAPRTAPVAGVRTPGLLAGLLAARRREQMRAQLPAALQAVSTSVRAGLSLPQALAAAGESVPRPLGAEFARVAEEIALGATLEASLAAFERRVALAETRLLVASLALARSTGASLAPLLDRLVETLRERERLRGQVRALTAQGRLSGIIVGAMPIALLVVMSLVDPEFVRPLVATPAGWVLLAAAAVLELLGAVTIRAVVRVEP